MRFAFPKQAGERDKTTARSVKSPPVGPPCQLRSGCGCRSSP